MSVKIRTQSGVALLAMLILCTIMMITMGGIFYRHNLEISSAHHVFTGEQATLLALSGESWVSDLLDQDSSQNDTDSLQDDWAQSIPPLPVEGGLLRGCIFDLQGRFNLNSLSVYNQERWDEALGDLSSSYLDTYLNLLALLEMDSNDSRAAVVVDWIDADDEIISGLSAESPEYLARQPSGLAANQMISSVDELGALAGYSSADINQLQHFVSALPRVTPININTAPPLILQALIPFVDDRVVEDIITERPFENVAQFKEFLAEATGYLSVDEVNAQLPDALVSVNSEFFGLLAQVEIGGVSMRLNSLIFRPQSGSPMVISRTFETLPVVEIPESMQALFRDPCSMETLS